MFGQICYIDITG